MMSELSSSNLLTEISIRFQTWREEGLVSTSCDTPCPKPWERPILSSWGSKAFILPQIIIVPAKMFWLHRVTNTFSTTILIENYYISPTMFEVYTINKKQWAKRWTTCWFQAVFDIISFLCCKILFNFQMPELLPLWTCHTVCQTNGLFRLSCSVIFSTTKLCFSGGKTKELVL